MIKLYKTKAITKTALFVFVVALLVTAGFYACKKPNEGINLIVNTSSLSAAPTLIRFYNAKKGAKNQPGDFQVTISGTNASSVHMADGGTNFKTLHGFLQLALAQGTKPSATNPISFVVSASLTGFAPVTRTIVLTKDTIMVTEVPMVEYANPVDGTAVVSLQSALTAGTSPGVAINTTPTAALPQNATFSIKPGTQMQDANGAAINASQLTSNIIQYSASNPAAVNSFPGGVSAANAVDASGKVIPGGINFLASGCLSVDMQAGGAAVKKFSQPIQVTQEIESTTVNLISGNVVAVGDTIPVWSIDETTGQWKHEATPAKVVLDVNNKLAASYPIAHLSVWMLGWTYATKVTDLTVNLNASPKPWAGIYAVLLTTPWNQLLFGFNYYTPITDGFEQQDNVFNLGAANQYATYHSVLGKYGFNLKQVPAVTAAQVSIYDTNNNALVAQSATFNPQTVGTVNVSIAAPAPPESVNVSVDISALCTSKNVVAKPSGWFCLFDENVGDYTTYVYINNGTVYNITAPAATAQVSATNTAVGSSFQLIVGHVYQMGIGYGNVWNDTEFTAKKGDFNLNNIAGTNSSALTGSAVYDATTNTLTVKGNITINCN